MAKGKLIKIGIEAALKVIQALIAAGYFAGSSSSSSDPSSNLDQDSIDAAWDTLKKKKKGIKIFLKDSKKAQREKKAEERKGDPFSGWDSNDYIFKNNEGLLPKLDGKTEVYLEVDICKPKATNRGPIRLVARLDVQSGDFEEAYVTADHYEHFAKVKANVHGKNKFDASRPMKIANFWLSYEREGLEHILKLRLEEVGITKDCAVGILPILSLGKCGNEAIGEIISRYVKLLIESTAKHNVLCVEVNLGCGMFHWVGIVLKKREDGRMNVIYLDSNNDDVPAGVKSLIDGICTSLRIEKRFTQLHVLQQKYANCGPELVENITWCLGFARYKQKTAILAHSLLYERSITETKNDARKVTCSLQI